MRSPFVCVHFSMLRCPPLCLVLHLEFRSPARMTASLPFLRAVCIHCSNSACTYSTGLVCPWPVSCSHCVTRVHRLPAPVCIYLASGFSGQYEPRICTVPVCVRSCTSARMPHPVISLRPSIILGPHFGPMIIMTPPEPVRVLLFLAPGLWRSGRASLVVPIIGGCLSFSDLV